MAFVIVRHRATTALLQRKARLGAVEGLDLTFLVDAQDQGLVRGIEIEPHDIVELLDKLLVPAELEGPDEMGLEVVSPPDPPHRRFAEALGLRHTPGAPVGRSRWGRVQCRLDDGPHFAFGDAWQTTGTWRILFEPCQAQSQKPLPPKLHRGSGDGRCFGRSLIADAIGRQLDDPRSLHQAKGDTPTRAHVLRAERSIGDSWIGAAVLMLQKIERSGHIRQVIYDALH